MIKLLLIVFLSLSVSAKDIYVKYRGYVNVDNGYLKHLNIGYSSKVKDMYYDKTNNYLLVKLNSTYYHYCGINQSVVNQWTTTSSLGRYYLKNIKGNYDCRIYPMPMY